MITIHGEVVDLTAEDMSNESKTDIDDIHISQDDSIIEISFNSPESPLQFEETKHVSCNSISGNIDSNVEPTNNDIPTETPQPDTSLPIRDTCLQSTDTTSTEIPQTDQSPLIEDTSHCVHLCCGRSARNTPYYTSEQICCPGWEHNAKSCSHLEPCYPGRCTGSRNTKTSMTTTVPTVNTTVHSFMNDTNRTEPNVSAKFTPVIEQGNATFTRRKATTKELISEYKIDATDKTEIDITWTNRPQFNLLQCNIIATFDADELFGYMPNIPDYIGNTSYGIVNAHFEIKHTKISLDGMLHVL
ncbi:unnamed protein product [Mytilus edulis]|uniref:Uncharacterized protein n=1 Tax=Mytilus edulis TaxID=6550 RepID=A0A8S3PNJ7_MYTED|nr:unnamed protein product [Mytilus edulis]